MGIDREDLKKILFKALDFEKKRSSISLFGLIGPQTRRPTPHPEAVILGILEDYEVTQERRSKNIENTSMELRETSKTSGFQKTEQRWTRAV